MMSPIGGRCWYETGYRSVAAMRGYLDAIVLGFSFVQAIFHGRRKKLKSKLRRWRVHFLREIVSRSFVNE